MSGIKRIQGQHEFTELNQYIDRYTKKICGNKEFQESTPIDRFNGTIRNQEMNLMKLDHDGFYESVDEFKELGFVKGIVSQNVVVQKINHSKQLMKGVNKEFSNVKTKETDDQVVNKYVQDVKNKIKM